jgi:CubicO group peptidase (beta-lactamase class C family)
VLLERARPIIDAAIGTVCTACVVRVERAGATETYATGTLDPDTGEPCTASAIFDLASLTKLATTALVLTLVRDGDLALDDPWQRLVPEYAEPRSTLRQVLTHTAGLAWHRDYYRVASGIEAIAALAAKEEIAYPPGRGYAYSDLGYIMFTAALARLAETPFAELLASRVLRPLGIREAELRYRPPDPRACASTELDATWRKRRVRGEVHDENAYAMGGIAGHAGLFGTAEAVAKLMPAYTRGAVIGEALASEARREQATGPNIRRGLGLLLRSPVGPNCSERFSLSSIGHTGFTGTSVWYDPEKDLLVVLLTNSVYYGRARDPYRFRIAVHEAIAG